MSLDPIKRSYSWNYSNDSRDNKRLSIVGTVLNIQEVQARKFSMTPGQPGAPDFWDDGNPKMNIRIIMAEPNGEIVTFTFQKAGKDAKKGLKKSIHMDLWDLTGRKRLTDLIGKTIQISTQDGNWQRGNPRPFTCALVEGGPYQANESIPDELMTTVEYCDEAVQGGMVKGMQPQPAVPMNIQPNAYQQYQPQPTQIYNQPQPVYQPQPQPMNTAPIPAGMDPQIAAAMQQLGATNIQPVAQTAEQQMQGAVPVQPYGDEEIPF